MRGTQKLKNVLTNIDNNFVFTTLNKNDKCYVWFNKIQLLNKEIIGQSTGQQINTITGPSCDSSLDKCYSNNTVNNMKQNGIFEAEDDYGTSYVYRGTINNNWIKFGQTTDNKDIWWRIIRINGNGTIRLIYAGTTTSGVNTYSAINTDITQIGTSAYNTYYNDNKYVGYMYGTKSDGSASSEGSLGITDSYRNGTNKPAHANNIDSDIKTEIDKWYREKTKLSTLSNKIDIETGFCNDRRIDKTHNNGYIGNGYGNQQTAYAGAHRVWKTGASGWDTTGQEPTLKCGDDDSRTYDLFTGSNAEGIIFGGKKIEGNNKLTNPVGLITMDEVLYAGGYGGQNNTEYWLYTNQNYWTMSSYRFSGSAAVVCYVDINGSINSTGVGSLFGVHPVINLKADTKFTVPNPGQTKGSNTNPYIVK